MFTVEVAQVPVEFFGLEAGVVRAIRRAPSDLDATEKLVFLEAQTRSSVRATVLVTLRDDCEGGLVRIRQGAHSRGTDSRHAKP